ncbi:MAG: HPr family phosphocarrier protein [Pseudomonadota bacterium]
MLTRQLTIINSLGLHTRAAAQVARIAQTASGVVTIEHNNNIADAASILDIIALQCLEGSRIIIRVNNEKDIQILESIEQLVKEKFGEER